MFMQIAIGAIGIGIVLMVGFVIISQVRYALPAPQVTNPCLGLPLNGTCTGGDNTSATINDSTYINGISSVQTTVYAGFGLVAIGIIVLAAFGLIQVFK